MLNAYSTVTDLGVYPVNILTKHVCKSILMWGGGMGRKCRQLELSNSKNYKKKKSIFITACARAESNWKYTVGSICTH